MKIYEPLRFGGGDGPFIEWETDFTLDDARVTSGLGCVLDAPLEDLLDIAMAAYITDRLRRRHTKGSRSDEWARTLPIEIAVRSTMWQRPEVAGTLVELLTFLSDDDWQITFLPPPPIRRFPETQPPLFDSDRPASGARFALFSGGLDSAAGAALDLDASDDELVLVSAGSGAPLRKLQAGIARTLADASQARVRSVIVPIGVRRRTFELFGGEDAEPTERTRGFVFLVLGAVTAAASGASELRVYENGPGALNLAQTAAQTGAMTTRAMRPETLQLMGQLISLVLDAPFRIVNPSFALTKAELVARVPARYRAILAASKSCDTALTYRSSNIRICGTCTSCLLRRQALRAAGLQDLDDAEAADRRCDVLAIGDPTDPDLAGMHLMLGQAARIETACASNRPWPRLVREFPELLGAAAAISENVTDADAGTVLTSLLSRYAAEWRSLPTVANTRYLSAA